VKVVIAGGGAVGTFIAGELRREGHDIAIIEIESAKVEAAKAIGEPPDVEWYVADACEVESLGDIGVGEADVVAAVTGDDEDNLVISLLAKQEFAVPRVVARVNNPKNEWLFNENWGVDVAVSTPHLILALTEEALSVGSLVRLLQLEKGRARLVEVTLAEDAPVIGPSIRELSIPRDSTFVAIVREDHVVVPRGDTVFQIGDEVIALVTPDSEDEIRRILTGK
jgi:trk system potassium uptake protein